MAVLAQEQTDCYAIYNGDCIEVMQGLPKESVHLSVYSPPFGGLYHYSSSERDLSNCRDYDQFFEHYTFVVREIERLTVPGRLTGVHCMDVPRGTDRGIIDFPGDIIRLHEREGFYFVGRYAVWKEPLGVRNRTMAKGLAHKQIVVDSSLCDVASADYLLMFRKKGKNSAPIAHPVGLLHYAGETPVPADLFRFRGYEGDQKKNKYSHWIWRRYASAFWDDVELGRVLPYEESKEPDDEKHIHPLQLDVIERCVHLWSNPGDVCLTPFMGVGSEVYIPVITGRKGIGIELKTSFYKQAVRNLQQTMKGWRDKQFLARQSEGALLANVEAVKA